MPVAAFKVTVLSGQRVMVPEGLRFVAGLSKNGNLRMPIELVEPERFFDMLGLAQQSGSTDPETCGFHGRTKPVAQLHSAFHLNSL